MSNPKHSANNKKTCEDNHIHHSNTREQSNQSSSGNKIYDRSSKLEADFISTQGVSPNNNHTFRDTSQSDERQTNPILNNVQNLASSKLTSTSSFKRENFFQNVIMKTRNELEQMHDKRYQFKVILLGNLSVGKTSIITYFTEQEFRNDYNCTIGIGFKLKTIYTNNKIADLHIWDTSGEERYKTITNQYYRDAAGIIITFDLSNEDSFLDIIHWIENVRCYAKSSAVILLIGNKKDLPRKVSYQDAYGFAKENNVRYYETSARTGENVWEMFEELAGFLIKIEEKEELSLLDCSISSRRTRKENGRISLTQNDHNRRNKKKKCKC